MSTRNLFDREALIQADCTLDDLATLAAGTALLVVLTVVVGDD